MSQTATQSRITEIEVVFKEIEEIYDLVGARRLVGSAKAPKVAVDNSQFATTLMQSHRLPKYTTDDGEPLEASESTLVPGVYQGTEVATYPRTFLRTFARARATDLDKSYVYVFSADDALGRNARLLHELYFTKGEFQLIDWKAQRGKDTRKPDKAKRTRLHLTITAPGVGRAHHFFLLAPRQLPWSALENAPTDIGSRGTRLHDPLFTDLFRDGDPSTAHDVGTAFKGKPPGSCGYLVYLVDPFAEAILRAHRYAKALDAWQKAQSACGSDPEYALAKRVDCFARRQDSLYEHVAKKLPSYLAEKERELAKLLLAAHNAVESLLLWVGREQRRARYGGVNGTSLLCNGKDYFVIEEPSVSPPMANAFSRLMHDYLNAPEAEYVAAAKVALVVQSRLNETAIGFEWMQSIFPHLLDPGDEFPKANAGAEMLFEAVRKGTGTMTELMGVAWSFLLKNWAPHWQIQSNQRATLTLQSWLGRCGVELDVSTPEAHRRSEAAADRERRRARTATERAKKGLEKGISEQRIEKRLDALWLDSRRVRAVHLSRLACDHIIVAIEIYNLALSLRSLREETNGWTITGLAGSAADFFGSIAKLSESLEAVTKIELKGASKVFERAPVVAVFSSFVDVILCTREMHSAKTRGESVGHGLRAGGSFLTLAAAVIGLSVAESPVGVALLVIGLAGESIGAWIAGSLTSAALFLRHCRWGDGGNVLEGALDRTFPKNSFGYEGQLGALGADVPAQWKAIDEIVYDFSPAVSRENVEGHVAAILHLVVGTATPTARRPSPFRDASKWTIRLELHRDFSDIPETFVFCANDELTDLDVSHNADIEIKRLLHKDENGSRYERAVGKVVVKGTVSVDVFGDGRHVIRRAVDESFRFGSVD